MSMLSPRRQDLTAGATGAAAGLAASFVQTGVGLMLDRVLLPPNHDNNIAPRLVDRVAGRAGHHTPSAFDWAAGTAFHLGYGLGWGALFGVVQARVRAPGLLLGGALGGLLYLLAFSRAGFGTRTGAEAPPDQRPWQKQVSLVSVAMTYALALALLFDRLPALGDRQR
jgi:hypothetical protein